MEGSMRSVKQVSREEKSTYEIYGREATIKGSPIRLSVTCIDGNRGLPIEPLAATSKIRLSPFISIDYSYNLVIPGFSIKF